ncbi:MAG: hypothetical protein A2Z14_12780 [Chloroflexi bacterium RBG_16_48_8]|nr:MAG: hypothetical protein A2Z14_12780 [Chloroflexi bacterium RBG_16_48_8]
MPEDSRIVKIQPFNGITQELKESSLTLEELDQLIREWVHKILANIDPPPDLWKRIKRRAKGLKGTENSCNS